MLRGFKKGIASGCRCFRITHCSRTLRVSLLLGRCLEGSSRILTTSRCLLLAGSPHSYGLGRADDSHDAVVVMNKSRTRMTSELYPVANSVIVSPTAIAPENFDRAWAKMRVPRLNRALGAWFWAHEWCTAYDEKLVSLPITGYILTPDKQRYVDPSFYGGFAGGMLIRGRWVYHHVAAGGYVWSEWQTCKALSRLRTAGTSWQGLLLGYAVHGCLPFQWRWEAADQ